MHFPLHLLLDFIDMFEAGKLRGVCRAFREAVTVYAWTDVVPVRSMKPWRASFGGATTLWYVGKRPVFYFPKQLRVLYLEGVKLVPFKFRRLQLTSATLKCCWNIDCVMPYFAKLQSLDLSYSTFSGEALRYLTCVETLVMRDCARLTDDDLRPLKTLTSLDMSGTYQIDRVLLELPKLKNLGMNGCRNVRSLSRLSIETLCACGLIANELFGLPFGLKKVCLANTHCDDDVLCPLTDAFEVDLCDTNFDRLAPLQGVKILGLARASLRGLRDLRGPLEQLEISDTRPYGPATFGHLTTVGTLTAHLCPWIDTNTFKYLQRVDVLEMACATQSAETMCAICTRLHVRTVHTCYCSVHLFEFPGGPKVHARNNFCV
jgi:hypothetical protein